MAKIESELTFTVSGLEECEASFGSIGEALQNAHVDLEGDIESEGYEIRFRGVTIVHIQHTEAWPHFLLGLKPAAGMILFIGSLMAMLPSRATVTWRDGWPRVYCPPNDEREVEDDPTPLVPNELVPA